MFDNQEPVRLTKQTLQEAIDHWNNMIETGKALKFHAPEYVILVPGDVPDEIVEILKLEVYGKATIEQLEQSYQYFNKRYEEFFKKQAGLE